LVDIKARLFDGSNDGNQNEAANQTQTKHKPNTNQTQASVNAIKKHFLFCKLMFHIEQGQVIVSVCYIGY
tara:strand:+ start:1759 stop:1968 length:210 start_codon:yes stop_codon:yes gene_type:complete